MVEPEALDLIDGDDTLREQEPMHRLVSQDQLAVYRHHGYWQNMDTLRDKTLLQDLWEAGNPPRRVWGSISATADNRGPSIPQAAI